MNKKNKKKLIEDYMIKLNSEQFSSGNTQNIDHLKKLAGLEAMAC